MESKSVQKRKAGLASCSRGNGLATRKNSCLRLFCGLCLAFATIVQSAPLIFAAEQALDEDLLLTNLALPVDVDIQAEPVREALKSLLGALPVDSQRSIALAFDERSLAEANVRLDAPVTFSGKAVQCQLVLNYVLEQAGAGWTVNGRLLLVTSRPVAENQTIVRAYDIEGFLYGEDDARRTAIVGRLMDVIRRQVAPGNWDPVVGRASIDPMTLNDGARLIIRHNAAAHLAIARFFGELQASPPLTAGEARIKKTLSESTTLEFVETPLTDVIGYINDLHGIQIQVHSDVLQDAGSDADTSITVNLSEISLASALRRILDPLDLSYVMVDEVLLIVTREQAEKTPAKFNPISRLTTPIYRSIDEGPKASPSAKPTE